MELRVPLERQQLNMERGTAPAPSNCSSSPGPPPLAGGSSIRAASMAAGRHAWPAGRAPRRRDAARLSSARLLRSAALPKCKWPPKSGADVLTEPRGNACCEAARVRAGWSLCCSRQPPSPGKEA
jgi:hypothetical protein